MNKLVNFSTFCPSLSSSLRSGSSTVLRFTNICDRTLLCSAVGPQLRRIRNLLIKSGLIMSKRYAVSSDKNRNRQTTVGSDLGSSDDSSIAPSNRKKKQRNQSTLTEFAFDKARVKLLSVVNDVSVNSNGIVYWMSRDQRVQDNWALVYAQRLAFKCSAPLHVCFCLVGSTAKCVSGGDRLCTLRHRDFCLRGLQEVEQECVRLNISFHLLHVAADDKNGPSKVLLKFVKQNNVGAIVTDFSPLRGHLKWVDDVKKILPKDVTFCRVDAHNIVPCWEASDKLEYGARTIRKKIQSKLPRFLTEFPPVVQHVFNAVAKPEAVDWETVTTKGIEHVDASVGLVDWAVPGTKAGLKVLDEFCSKRLQHFGSLRNDPTKDNLSNLSPWLHFGQISAQRCALTVSRSKRRFPESVDAFLEEAIVRRELADNFCFYNANYDTLEGTNKWARKTLDDHRSDKRDHLYTRKQLEDGHTYDDLWNSAQMQMVRDGKMHGFLRMYWAKKILEWTASPEEALATAIYLNDKYELDGSDPNGFVGCMWSIAGIHDQGWREREVFGKIRYMNYKGCERKFNVKAFVARHINAT